ncbi:23S rRNA (uracil(1939)-C(5))-methyltransferase RlmD [Mycoplasmopsis phocirhinis]|uniref:23S rRNA (Uracil(1939)-C(5))-methyltransferase RlmD n=1 Tax=Mycoplasmopsis phocirhinis TaxID=142650 RepID=A0A4P6MPL9_9BACT|nr:23S rRNA (uracil(1939)-C(5))-methyltransferase RlmD [Mycoplasmopsis phocirhinis]QBF34850.1 23S rRNA (uracil(1939)-C(5))-methyltransferase RlmD [Mycoplasmopsis phocirhinis]
MKFSKNQIINNVKAINLSYEGLGVVKLNNYTIFVENLLTGESADIEIKKANNKFAFAKVIKRFDSSQQRLNIANEQLMKSGATPLAILSYSDQLKFKEEFVKYLFARNIHFDNVFSILENKKPWAYRNKITVFVSKQNSKIIFGLYEKNTHNIIEQYSYDLANEEINHLIKWLSNNINNFNEFIANIDAIESFTFRYSKTFDEHLIIINAKKNIKIGQNFLKIISSHFPNLVNIIINIKSNKKNKYFALLNNKNSIKDKIGKNIVNINWNSFFQVNSSQTERLYQLLIDNLKVDKNDIVIDAYCGVGSIALSIAPYVKKVYGLEIIQDAVLNAKQNARINNINNCEFFAGDVEDNFFKIKNANILVVDPPRSGLSTNFINLILKYKPKKIGYISCNIHTMCRDIDLFLKNGYKLDYLRPCDMFSQTHHIECVGVLSKN